MVRIETNSNFEKERKKFIKNNLQLAEKVIKAIKLLTENPSHPSLNLEKLKGSNIWTVRIDKGNRIYLTWIDKDKVFLLDIGPHDKYRKY
ncbi:hypothetical protein A3A74_06270 [Candidatus Roizmanbacteria bacterium RIFCSPLOWO2_01_FULL_35_13]|uniref:Uncharacterized protein n=1 Tax=Candidatus Roizmanbacteria bacterium RIFCSPLOWO2_01_FULL_35_13 TaxID=1802055 RepID=A0A1F7IGX3_9BACT|nr:MAG: hypothetical protein A3A74_06270 [Candidatus Roizmanbacteria bacterium RIFCSPLOWO2_01_FULL_35_13]